MNRSLVWRGVLILGIVLLFAFAAYPPKDKIRLGLDLRGGIHLVLDVVVDEAVAAQVRTDMGRFEDLLGDDGVVPAATSLDSGTSFSMTFNTDFLRDQAELIAIDYYTAYDV